MKAWRALPFLLAAYVVARYDGNANGRLALAARFEMAGAREDGQRWLERARVAVEDAGLTLAHGELRGTPGPAFERLIERHARDDAARRWWRERLRPVAVDDVPR